MKVIWNEYDEDSEDNCYYFYKHNPYIKLCIFHEFNLSWKYYISLNLPEVENDDNFGTNQKDLSFIGGRELDLDKAKEKAEQFLVEFLSRNI